ncbi:aspartate aminotransferase family protein [Salinithrix halophila]|uniref:Aspartate aminotransferase family protein n=1 Tax=Salinithrix halophila TaxID=1485204 RepID=A0ABV8JB17_9BACL
MSTMAQRDWKYALAPVWPHFTELQISRGKGSFLFDREGNPYLDFTSGIGVTNTGHCHPRIVQAIQAQAEKLLHGQATILYHEPMQELVKELRTVIPDPLDCFFLTNSGSEAVESALKLARHATGRTNVTCFQGGYHGRTIGAMSVTTAKTVYRLHYQPLMPGVAVAPYPRRKEDVPYCLEELERLLVTQTAPSETAAMIVEPILGEGGYIVPPAGFLPELRRICDEHGILLILDEIQSGFGRTGQFFAFEHEPMIPDICIMAKGLASGLPLSGIAAPREVMERWVTGSHGGTYGGNPLACAAAAETIRVLKEESLPERAATLGKELIASLNRCKDSGEIHEVRGRGLMVGCEFRDTRQKPDRDRAAKVRLACLQQGLILLTCGTYDHVIRWIPPLTVSQSELSQALTVFESALMDVDPS